MTRKLAVVAAVIENQGRILIARRLKGAQKDLWEFPGGKYEAGESGPEALKREIREEFETEIKVGELLCTIEHQYPDFLLVMDCFLCSLESNHLVLHDHSSCRWIDPFEENVEWVPADVKVITSYRNYLKQKAI